MTELLKNAWLGWEQYIQDGKLIALFLAVLLFGWFYKKCAEHQGLWLYATVATVGCICPMTAALLMTYQTKFYDYQWIWSAVPVTMLTAYGITLFLSEQWSSNNKAKRKTAVAVTLLALGILLLSGGMGNSYEENLQREQERAECEEAYRMMAELRRMAGEDASVTLWAPADILEYAREADGGVKLLYGRNMWDISLNAYSYDEYSEEIKALYEKMENWAGAEMSDADEPGAAGLRNPAEYALVAVREGVNCIIVPDSVAWAAVLDMAEVLGTKPQRVEDYWVLYGRVD